MTTKLYQVVTSDGVNVRKEPRLGAHKATSYPLGYHDILEVLENTRTEADGYEWWEHSQNRGLWSAAQDLSTGEIYMQPYDLPHHQTETTCFEVVTDVVNVRNKPKLGDTLTGQSLRRGERYLFQNPIEADGFLWWEQVNQLGSWSASGSLQGGQTFMLPAADDNSGIVRQAVPWFTQIQSPKNLANDCGHACALMLLRFHGHGNTASVESLYALKFHGSEGKTTKEQLVQLAGSESFEFTPFRYDATPAGLVQVLGKVADGRPVILLVQYASLGFNNPSGGTFLHWIVLTGFNGDTIYVNDPLWLTERSGAGRKISRSTLLKACVDTKEYDLYGVY